MKELEYIFGHVIRRLQAIYIKNRRAKFNEDKKEFCVCSRAFYTSHDTQCKQHFHSCDWTFTLCSLHNYV